MPLCDVCLSKFAHGYHSEENHLCGHCIVDKPEEYLRMTKADEITAQRVIGEFKEDGFGRG